jgi:hypothetical protein
MFTAGFLSNHSLFPSDTRIFDIDQQSKKIIADFGYDPRALHRRMVRLWPDDRDGSLEIMALVLMVGLAELIGMLLPIGSNRRTSVRPDGDSRGNVVSVLVPLRGLFVG